MESRRVNNGRLRYITPCVIAVWLLPASIAGAQIPEKATIRYVKRLPVSKLDSTLNRGRFSTWLAGVVGASAALRWELNDCGEQTGVPAIDTARDLPSCVGVYAEYPDHRKIGITVVVGTIGKGVFGPPCVYNMFLESGGITRTFRSLRDLQKALKKSQPK